MKSCLTTLCYIEKDDCYLMLHRVKKEQDINKDKWIGIGGHFEGKESPEECLLREVKEETGMEVCRTEYLFSLPNRYLYSDFEVHTLDLFYRCQVERFDGLMANDDAAEVFFIPLDRVNPDEFGLNSIRRGVIKFLSMSI